MTPDHFAAVRAFFNEVIDLPDDAREARLRTLTADADVIRDVLMICRTTDGGATASFSAPVNAMLSSVAPLTLAAGDTLGAWRIVGVMGQGGMGTVFRARRSDGHFEQDAAVKVLHGIPSAKSLEYLARERQILATLSHPNIARLLDGGATPGGQPYLVMEHVEGVAIDSYCRDRRLPTRDVLKLMIDVCAAIGFAHQRLIVHCDIKPSNILVTPTGRPVLLDFGIARLLKDEPIENVAADPVRPPAAAANAGHTLAHAFTPQYASPEQRNGEALTTATDVFGLGRLLHELLEIVRSSSDSKAALNDELQAVIRKATEDDPTKRYASPAALAADVEHYLRSEPLAAVAASPFYVARKFSQRNWPWLAAAAVFVLTVGAAAQRIVAERDRAQASEAKAVTERNRATQAEAATRQTSDFLISVFDASNPNAESGDIPASKLIIAAEARLEQQMKGQPETQALMYAALARVQSNMGRPNEARANYRRAIEIERKQNRPLELARMLTLEFQNDILKLDNSNLVALAREALTLRERHAAPDSEEMGESLALMGYALRATSGDMKEAEKLLSRSLVIRERIDPTSLGTAETLHIAGQVYALLVQRDKAIDYYRRSVAIKQAKLGDGHPEVLNGLQYLASELNRARQFAESETLMRRIVVLTEKLHGRQNVKMIWPLIYLGSVLSSTGRPRESLQVSQEALAITEKTAGRDSVYGSVVLSNIGVALLELGDEPGASVRFREALAIMKKRMRPTDAAVAAPQRHLGHTLHRMGKYAESRPHLLAAHETYLRISGEAHRTTLMARVDLLRCAMGEGNLTEASDWLAKLKPALAKADKDMAADIVLAGATLAARQGRHDEAAQGFEEAERAFRAVHGAEDARTWLAVLPRAEWLAVRGQPENRAQSRELARDILANVRDKLNPGAPILARLAILQGQ